MQQQQRKYILLLACLNLSVGENRSAGLPKKIYHCTLMSSPYSGFLRWKWTKVCFRSATNWEISIFTFNPKIEAKSGTQESLKLDLDF